MTNNVAQTPVEADTPVMYRTGDSKPEGNFIERSLRMIKAKIRGSPKSQRATGVFPTSPPRHRVQRANTGDMSTRAYAVVVPGELLGGDYSPRPRLDSSEGFSPKKLSDSSGEFWPPSANSSDMPRQSAPIFCLGRSSSFQDLLGEDSHWQDADSEILSKSLPCQMMPSQSLIRLAEAHESRNFVHRRRASLRAQTEEFD